MTNKHDVRRGDPVLYIPLDEYGTVTEVSNDFVTLILDDGTPVHTNVRNLHLPDREAWESMSPEMRQKIYETLNEDNPFRRGPHGPKTMKKNTDHVGVNEDGHYYSKLNSTMPESRMNWALRALTVENAWNAMDLKSRFRIFENLDVQPDPRDWDKLSEESKDILWDAYVEHEFKLEAWGDDFQGGAWRGYDSTGGLGTYDAPDGSSDPASGPEFVVRDMVARGAASTEIVSTIMQTYPGLIEYEIVDMIKRAEQGEGINSQWQDMEFARSIDPHSHPFERKQSIRTLLEWYKPQDTSFIQPGTFVVDGVTDDVYLVTGDVDADVEGEYFYGKVETSPGVFSGPEQQIMLHGNEWRIADPNEDFRQWAAGLLPRGESVTTEELRITPEDDGRFHVHGTHPASTFPVSVRVNRKSTAEKIVSHSNRMGWDQAWVDRMVQNENPHNWVRGFPSDFTNNPVWSTNEAVGYLNPGYEIKVDRFLMSKGLDSENWWWNNHAHSLTFLKPDMARHAYELLQDPSVPAEPLRINGDEIFFEGRLRTERMYEPHERPANMTPELQNLYAQHDRIFDGRWRAGGPVRDTAFFHAVKSVRGLFQKAKSWYESQPDLPAIPTFDDAEMLLSAAERAFEADPNSIMMLDVALSDIHNALDGAIEIQYKMKGEALQADHDAQVMNGEEKVFRTLGEALDWLLRKGFDPHDDGETFSKGREMAHLIHPDTPEGAYRVHEVVGGVEPGGPKGSAGARFPGGYGESVDRSAYDRVVDETYSTDPLKSESGARDRWSSKRFKPGDMIDIDGYGTWGHIEEYDEEYDLYWVTDRDGEGHELDAGDNYSLIQAAESRKNKNLKQELKNGDRFDINMRQPPWNTKYKVRGDAVFRTMGSGQYLLVDGDVFPGIGMQKALIRGEDSAEYVVDYPDLIEYLNFTQQESLKHEAGRYSIGKKVVHPDGSVGEITGISYDAPDQILVRWKGGSLQSISTAGSEVWISEASLSNESLKHEECGDDHEGDEDWNWDSNDEPDEDEDEPVDEAAAENKTKFECLECGKQFSRKLGKNTYEVKCPGCGSYDVDIAGFEYRKEDEV